MATALLGTDQRKCTVAAPEVAFLAALEGADREQAHEAWVLLASAYAATVRRAGQVPPAAHASELFPPAPAETMPYCADRIAARIRTMLNEVRLPEPFLEEALTLLARKKRIVPPAVLPDLLNWGLRSKARRALIAPVMGERGRWLAQVNPEWKNLLDVDPKDVAVLEEAARKRSGQQALHAALEIDDNFFAKSFSVLKGQGLGGNSRLLQQAVDKITALGKPGQPFVPDVRSVSIAIAVPPVILPELISRLRQMRVKTENAWWARLVELMESRQQLLEELNHE